METAVEYMTWYYGYDEDEAFELFDELDVNGDGRWDYEEQEAFYDLYYAYTEEKAVADLMNYYGYDEAEALEIFNRFDENGDGIWDYEGEQEAFYDWYYAWTIDEVISDLQNYYGYSEVEAQNIFDNYNFNGNDQWESDESEEFYYDWWYGQVNMEAPYDLDEFIFNEAGYLDITDEEAAQIFESFDDDMDGLWDDDEYNQFYLEFYALNLEDFIDYEAPYVFDEFDSDQDGLLNAEEEADYVDTVYYSDDCDGDCWW